MARTQMVSHQLQQALGEVKIDVDLLKARSANDQNQVGNYLLTCTENTHTMETTKKIKAANESSACNYIVPIVCENTILKGQCHNKLKEPSIFGFLRLYKKM